MLQHLIVARIDSPGFKVAGSALMPCLADGAVHAYATRTRDLQPAAIYTRGVPAQARAVTRRGITVARDLTGGLRARMGVV